MAERIARRERRVLTAAVETSSVAMVRSLAADAGLVGLLLQENIVQDLESGRLRWLALADVEAHSRICLYQRSGQNLAVASDVFSQFLDAELGRLASALS